MRVVVLLVLVLANFNAIEGYNGNCKIPGVSYWSVDMDTPIGDTYERVIAIFQMEQTKEMLSYESTYLDATFSNNTLTISTNERFKKFEEEFTSSYYSAYISIELEFLCDNNNTKTLYLDQDVEDDNTHDPIFSKDVYEYHFGMPIPENYELTRFMSINASDLDFLNSYIYNTMDYSEDLTATYRTDDRYNTRIYQTTLKALKELKAPFRTELTIVAGDEGEPQRKSSTRIIVTVTDNGNSDDGSDSDGDGGNKETGAHPPVFAKHLYFANYTAADGLIMEEPITFKYGGQKDTKIRQSGYDEYFKIALKTKDALEVLNMRPLPDTILESTAFIVIEIEAENKNLHMPGRTALVINFSANKQELYSSRCESTQIFGVSSSSTLSLIFFLTAIFMIIVMNIVVLLWFYQKKKMEAEIVRMTYPISPISDIPRMEKIKI